MKLTHFEFTHYIDQPQQWTLKGFDPDMLTLLVGQNASGKSRTLSVINTLARLLSGKQKLGFDSAKYTAHFDNGPDKLVYCLTYKNSAVIEETFKVNDNVLLDRGAKGEGVIYAALEKKQNTFQTPPTELATVARQDSLQHPFFEPLHQWARSLRYFAFGTPMGKNSVAVIVKDSDMPLDLDNPDQVIGVFRKGKRDYDPQFTDSILEDMRAVQYDLETIDTGAPTAIKIQGPLAGPAVTLHVKERDLTGITEQFEMSQGMFRALSIIIQLNYSRLASTPSSILIDDIGEGLDFERSCLLIHVLIKKAAQSNVQLIMSTNDRFVMNTVPLNAWSILKRDGNDSRVYNYNNARKQFEDFAITGLNNFDFFALDFLSEGGSDEENRNIR